MTTKGQVTIPAKLREKLGLRPGDRVAFVEQGGNVLLRRIETRVESGFGLVKARKTASLDDFAATIADSRGRRARR